MLTPRLLLDGPEDAPLTVVLAHGAGAPMDSPFMNAFAEGLAAAGLRVARFEFPYMQLRRETGGRRRPDCAPLLIDAWRAVIGRLGGAADLVIGGKSLGGRIASMMADDEGARGLVCLGYPFHAPGRAASPERLTHLATLKTPALIVQGARDVPGACAEVAGYGLSPAIRVAWIEDGDHSLKPRKSGGRPEAQNLAEGVEALVEFVGSL